MNSSIINNTRGQAMTEAAIMLSLFVFILLGILSVSARFESNFSGFIRARSIALAGNNSPGNAGSGLRYKEVPAALQEPSAEWDRFSNTLFGNVGIADPRNVIGCGEALVLHSRAVIHFSPDTMRVYCVADPWRSFDSAAVIHGKARRWVGEEVMGKNEYDMLER